MQESYTSNYLKIYSWQGLSIILGFISMFVVTPYMSSNKAIYGIYMVCISLVIFLSYADLGFIGSGQKYAAEYFARGDKTNEKKVIGFSCFILLIFVVLCSLVFGFFSIYPGHLINNITNEESIIASRLLLILTISAPVIVLQRMVQMIFSIRIEDYIVQRFSIIGSILRIISVFYFFRKGSYDIVGYYFFFQSISVFISVTTIIVANNRYHYGIGDLLRSIRFNKEIFDKTKRLAFSNLFLTFSWILYYECDNFVIGKILSPEKVALYAIGFTVLTFVRSLFGTLFGPFLIRFNHLIGANRIEDLRSLFNQIIGITLPIVLCIILPVVILMRPFVLTWVGSNYEASINVGRLLLCCNIFAFISYPVGALINAQERIKLMNLTSALIPIVYWVGVAFTFKYIDIVAFGLFKFLAFFVSAIIYFVIAIKFLNISFLKFFKNLILPNVIPLIILVFSLLFIKEFLPLQKSKLGLLQVIGAGVLCASLSFTSTYFFNPFVKSYVKKIVTKFNNRV
jgi:O-antigen/teichoic acid export membrane protein